MAITCKELEDLIQLTMKDCPLPSVVEVLCATKPDDMDIMFNFIKEHYTKEQIEFGVTEFCERVQLMNKLYGEMFGVKESE